MTCDYKVEAYLGTAWTDITDDVRNDMLTITRGIPGAEVSDRVADVGTFDFTLDNSAGNSGTLLGYYSPDNANVRAGFDIGMKVRCVITTGGTPYYKFYGKVTDPTPSFGQYRERTTAVQAVDYMDELLVHNMELVAVQTGKKGNELLGTIVANLPTAPLATSYATGPDIFGYALHDIQDETSSGMSAAQKVDMSGLSFTFVTGDLTGGEKLNWQTRHTRALSTSVATFNDTMTGLVLGRSAKKIYGTVKAKGYPVQAGTAVETLWTSRREIVLGAGGSATFDIMYVDPSGAGSRVALVPSSGVTPVSGTDWQMSSVSGDGGSNLNANLTYTVNTWGGNTANVTIANGAGVSGYINLFQLRGKIIRLNDPVTVTKTDAASKATYGDRTLTHVMTYQDNVNVVDAFAVTILAAKKAPHSDIDSLEFIAGTDALMATAMALDVGSRITVIETVTGISTDFFVNKYILTIEGNILHCKLENLESLASAGVIGIWGTNASDSTFWGAGTGVIGNWIF